MHHPHPAPWTVLRGLPYVAWVILYCAVSWGIFGALLGAITPNLRAQMGVSFQQVGWLMAFWSAGGAIGSLLPIFNTASQVGYGAVIASLAAFVLVRDFVVGIAPDTPTISLAIAVNALAGITGSASGGMSIALATMGDTYLARGLAAGIAPEVLHRVTAIATGGLDALPHSGAVVTLLAICRLTHREAYADIFAVACAGPILALVVVLVLAGRFGAF